MKLKSLLLGSAAALALSTGAQAADPIASFVSLDVCDAYGISGLTIASDDTCLKISGSVSYEFRWGDYAPSQDRAFYYADGGGTSSILDDDGTNDWRSRLETILQFEATTQTDEGAARAVIRLRERQRSGGGTTPGGDANDRGHDLRAEQAYVSFGDTTVLSAGMKPSIARTGHGSPYNFLGLVNANEADSAGGADWRFGGDDAHVRTGGTGFSVVSEFGDGFRAGVGLENINRWERDALGFPSTNNIITTDDRAGTVVGFVEATGAWGGAHLTLMVDDALNGFEDSVFAFHTGATANFDQFAVTAALAGNSEEYFNGVLSGQGTFDLFTIALSGEFASVGANNPANPSVADLLGLGFGGSIGFQATDTVAVNLGARYWDWDAGNEVPGDTAIWDVALGVTAALTDSLEAAGTLGYESGNGAGDPFPVTDEGAFYGEVGLAYAPGGGFATGGKLRVNTLGAYRVDLNASKSF